MSAAAAPRPATTNRLRRRVERPRLIGEARHDPVLEAARRLLGRDPAEQAIGDRTEAADLVPAGRAARQVAEQRRPFLAIDDVEGEVGGLRPHVVTR